MFQEFEEIEEIEEFVEIPDDTKSNEFLIEMMNTINNNMRDLNNKLQQCGNIEEKEIVELFSETCDYVRRGAKICDNVQFMTKYYNNLMFRLENGSHFKLEEQIQNVISSKNHPELYTKMIFCIEDIKLSGSLTKYMHNLPLENIKFSSPKYKDVTPSMFNKNMCKFFLYRTYAWSQKNDIGKLNLPVELSYYTDIFMNLPKIKNTKENSNLKHKKLFVDYIRSNTTFEMKINGNKYNFKANLLQASIILLFIKFKKMTIQDLFRELQIVESIEHMSIIYERFYSLIFIDFVLGDFPANKNFLSITYSLNEKFTSKNKDINLTSINNHVKENDSWEYV
jgi:hypothetical protein